MTNITSQLGDALAHDDHLPVSWRPADRDGDPLDFIGINVRNEEILQNILMLERQHSELPDDDSDRYASELAHIDFKINLLLDLMVQVFSSQLSLPPERPVSMSSTHLQWQCDQALAVDDVLFVDVYLSRRFPRPLTLFGHVSYVEPQGQGRFSIVIDLEEVGRPVMVLLEKFIFMKHRRMIALSRKD